LLSPICFAVWTIFSIIGVQIKEDMGLSDTQFSLLIGTPILTGSLIRLCFWVFGRTNTGDAQLLCGRHAFSAFLLGA
jgi:nitrate/nitrite transporter NarK